jgi:sporulation protein YlmC with PRC-barrel domain
MIKIKNPTLIASAISAAFFLTGPSAFAHVAGQNEQIGAASINVTSYANKMMDMDIINMKSEDIGSIVDFALSEDGKVEYAIVLVGGVMGLGGKKVAVPFNQLKVRQNDGKIGLDATKEQLEQAKEFQYEQ